MKADRGHRSDLLPEYGALKVDQAKRLKDLEMEMENARLRRALSDAVIDNQILQEVSKGNF